MNTEITLTVVEGKLKGETFVFDSRDICILGRSFDCRPKLPDDEAHQSISRYHCLLDISPPMITIRDFGSLNGTFLNGTKIGQRDESMTPEEASRLTSHEHPLKHGDEITVGESVFRVLIADAAPGPDAPTEPTVPSSQPRPLDSKSSPTQATTGKQAAPMNETQPVHLDEKQLIDRAALATAKTQSKKQTITTLDMVKNLLNKDRAFDLPEIPGYRFLEKIGEGVSGEVYLVQQAETQRRFACKLMHPQTVMHPQSRLEFQREIDIISELDHPNIVRFIDKGYQDDLYYFIMEFCNAGTVQQLIDTNQGNLPVQDALAITIEVLKGLEYAHNVEVNCPAHAQYPALDEAITGLVHRDIKPTNIFISHDDEGFASIKIGDFGLAKAFDMAGLSGCTMTGAMAGSLCFVPRWQIVNYKYTGPETDLWATAACCYYMITGEIPRQFQAGIDPVKTILEQAPIPIQERAPDISPHLAGILDSVLRDFEEPTITSATELRRLLQPELLEP